MNTKREYAIYLPHYKQPIYISQEDYDRWNALRKDRFLKSGGRIERITAEDRRRMS